MSILALIGMSDILRRMKDFVLTYDLVISTQFLLSSTELKSGTLATNSFNASFLHQTLPTCVTCTRPAIKIAAANSSGDKNINVLSDISLYLPRTVKQYASLIAVLALTKN
jgi:hypothetical protein